MLQVTKFEGKTEEDAINKAMLELNSEKNNLIYTTETKEGKLFKSGKTIVTVIQKSSLKEYINDYFKELGNKMNIEIETEVLYKNDGFDITILTSNNSLLIGKEGKTLNALQTLVRQAIKNNTSLMIKLNLDVSNYQILLHLMKKYH